MSQRCLSFLSDFPVHIPGLIAELACMLVLQIRIMRLSCALICGFPPAVASLSTRSLLVCTIAKHMILILCLAIAPVGLAAVLNDRVTDFASSGSCLRPFEKAPPAPRYVLRRKS